MHSSTGGRTTSLTIPAHNAKSKYAAAWEPYVAANLFLYLQPLAIFLRRSRELDFSAGKCDNSIKLVQRAFRVFTPELVATLSRLLQGQSNWNHLIERHREILGVYAPPPGPMTMQSLQSDMQSLLEEIHMQHVKKLRELDPVSRAFHKLEHWFGHGVLSGQEKALERLLANARIITQLPLEYNVSLSASERSRSASATFDGVGAPQRTATGELSDTGREQLLRGQVKCNPADIPFRGDKMRMRVMTYEVGVLVTLAIRLSDWLNKKFDIDPNDKSRMFRFNLRFLANYRNLFYIAVFVYILSYGLA